MYFNLSLLFLALIIVGAFLTWLLFGFRWSALQAENLDKKIMMWVPFAFIFILILYLGSLARLMVLLIILTMINWEFFRVSKPPKHTIFFVTFITLFIGAFFHLGLIGLISPPHSEILLFLIVGTVVSDVCGFFFGNFFGWHKLPEIFNKNKSWEGVLGQVVGALIGVILIKYLIVHQGNILIFLPIGIGSAIGDLLNSRAKRLACLKN